ncbi:MAG: proteasome activator [Acidimicrobiia bacterium]
MADEAQERPVRPEVVRPEEGAQAVEGEHVTQPSKLMRIAAMTRAMLDEVRQAPLDEAGRKRLVGVHERSLQELAEVLSEDLREELSEIVLPFSGDSVSESELRIAQAQLVGWLEGLFAGIQATLWSQQVTTASQLEEVRRRRALQAQQDRPGQYL